MKSNYKRKVSRFPGFGVSLLSFIFLTALFPGTMMAQWNTNTSVNLEISSLAVADMESVPTTDGKTWIAFYVQTGSNYDMRAQLLDANGYKLLGTDGMLVSNQPSGSSTWVFNVCVDGSNNLIIGCQDMRAGSDVSAVVYKISQAGAHLWSSNGIVLGLGLSPYCVALTTGEVVVAWNESSGNTLAIQKITTGGALAWTTPVSILVGTSTTTRGQLIANLAGKFTMVYQKRGVGISTTLYAQMFSNAGTSLYSALQICNQTTSGARYYSIAAEADTVYFGYYSSSGSRFNSFLQRINPAGAIPWGMNGSNFNTFVSSGDSYQGQTDIGMTPGSNYVWSICNFSNPAQSQYGVYAQKFLKTTGARQFTDGAKVVYAISTNSDQHSGNIALVSDTPMFLSYDATEKIYATRLDANGNFAWTGNRVEISSTTAQPGVPKMRYGFTPDGPNRCAGIWTENRGTDYMGYAQGVSIGGLIGIDVTTLGSVPAVITTPGGTLQMVATIFPSTASQSVTWSIVQGTGNASISTGGLVTASSNGTVYAKAVAVQDITMKDSLLITISGQVVLAPSVTTNAATGVTGVVATLNGTVNANGASTAVSFQWGLTASYGNTATATPSPVTGGVPTAVLANLSGLLPVTTYHFRCVGTNAVGTTNGADMTFTTCQPPAAAGTITGSANVCQGQTGVIYSITAIPFATSYNWTVPSGANITAGAGTTAITVTFLPTAISGNVTVAGTNSCATGTGSTLAVNVSAPPVPSITGPYEACAGTTNYTYTTETGMSGYTWTVTAGGSIISGAGTSSIQVQWSAIGPQSVSVTYTNTGGCQAQTPTVYNVTVSDLPGDAGTITGADTVCAGTEDVLYSINPVTGATSYVWSLPPGATIASGTGTSNITVDFADNATTGVISVVGNNSCGSGGLSEMDIIVNPIPDTPVVDSNGIILTSSAPLGNQWYKDGAIIPGQTGQEYTVTQDGWYWTVVTLNGCSSAESNHIYIVITGIVQPEELGYRIYPVPNDGQFTISFTSVSDNTCTLEIFNVLGTRIFQLSDFGGQDNTMKTIDLRPVPPGIYTLILRNRDSEVVKKFTITR